MHSNSFSPRVQPWSVVEENKEYSTPIFKLLKQRIQLDSETDPVEGDFYILQAPAWINVIPITPDNKVVLVEQFRHGIQQPTLEVPGGLVDPGEEPLEAAKREMLEETGYKSKQWSSLGKVSSNPSMMDNYTHMYLAENCSHVGAQNPDEHERIAVRTVPVDEFLQMAANGTIHHAIVLAAIARYLLIETRR